VEAKASALGVEFPKGTVEGNSKISAASLASLPTSRAVLTYRGLGDRDATRSSSSSSFLRKSGLRHQHRHVHRGLRHVSVRELQLALCHGASW
jgi:hypothetical protein